MKIIQTTSVLEPSYVGDALFWRDEATIYGLADDGKMYYWGRTKSTKIEHEPDEEGNTHHYKYEYGWKPYQP